MAISVCLSIMVISCLEHSIFIFQPQILHDDFRMTQRALRRHSSCYLLDEFVNAASVIIVLSKFVWYYIASYNITNVDLRQVLEVFDVDNLQGMLVENKL